MIHGLATVATWLDLDVSGLLEAAEQSVEGAALDGPHQRPAMRLSVASRPWRTGMSTQTVKTAAMNVPFERGSSPYEIAGGLS